MGCAPSGSSCKKGGIRLMATKLAFTKGQLHNLDTYFRKLVDESQNDSSNAFAIEATVERLVQRLMVGAGNLDRRFSSMFLVSLNEPRGIQELRFEYLLRIDALSTPSLGLGISRVSVEEDASLPGFIRLKMLGIGAEAWREYMDAAGRLRRDLVKAKLANLLAAAIKRDVTGGTADDKLCVSPGQVVDAEVLDKIFKQPDYCRIFYGPAVSDGPLSERRNHRVAMIEDAAGILLRIGLDGFKAREVEGMYAVAVGPYSGARCENRATLWRVRVPAAEKIMSQHYAVDSVPSLTESVLLEILYELRDGRCPNLPMLKSKMNILPMDFNYTVEPVGRDVLCSLFTSYASETAQRGFSFDVFIYENIRSGLKKRESKLRPTAGKPRDTLTPLLLQLMGTEAPDTTLFNKNLAAFDLAIIYPPLCTIIRTTVSKKGGAPVQDRLRVVSRSILKTVHRWALERAGPDPLTSWAPDTLSRHVLLALDELVAALKCQNLRCYFHPRCNVMLQCARGGIVHREDSYVSDCRLVESYLETLHYSSSCMTRPVPRPLDVMESELIVRWRDIMASLPRGTSNEDYGYSQRQLEYFSLILEQVLRAKYVSLEDHSDAGSYLNFPELSYRTTEQVENLVFLLKLVLIQARDQIHAMANRKVRVYDHLKESKKKRHYNTSSQFDYSVGLLIDVVRRDRETASVDLESFPIMTKMLLQWLYFGMDYDRRILEPILRPYLNNLFNSLHEYGWCSTPWKKKQELYTSEMQSLTMFCKSVITQEESPANGIVEYLSKGWCWAESMTKMIERSGNSLRLVFLPGDEVIKYNLTFTENKGLSSFSTWSKARSVSMIARRKRMNSRAGELLDTMLELRRRSKETKGHRELRDVSPLTYVTSMSRSRARHRGPADLISAMLSLGKFRVLQEVAAILPRDEQVVMLDMVQRVARESSRRCRKAICVDSPNSPREIYRPRPESELLDSSPRLSPGVRERRIIAEHQKQLEREMQEMHDTLRRNALMRQRPCIWDSHSVSSWSSSIDSIAGTITLRKYRTPIWEAIKGNSPARASLRVDRNIEKNKFDEMISREESPTWSTLDARRKLDDSESKNGDGLPSWDTLEATLNRRLCNYGNALSGSLETDESIGRNCVETSRRENDSRPEPRLL